MRTGSTGLGAPLITVGVALVGVVLPAFAQEKKADPAASVSPAAFDPERKYSKEQLVKDFDVFRRTFTYAHPGLDRYTSKKQLDAEWCKARDSITVPATEREFYSLLTRAVSEIKDGHTECVPSNDYRKYVRESAKTLPLRLRCLNGRYYVVGNVIGADHLGCEVLTINGRKMQPIIRRLIDHLSGDGDVETGKQWKLNDNFAYYYYLLIERPEYFELEVRPPGAVATLKVKVGAVTSADVKTHAAEAKSLTTKSGDKPLQLVSLRLPNAALLKIGTFNPGPIEKAGQDFARFLEASFNEIKASGVRDLVIDLRGNDGGENYGPLLFSYLANKPFRYFASVETNTNDLSPLVDYCRLDADFRQSFAKQLVSAGGGRFRVAEKAEPGLALRDVKASAYGGRVWFLINGEVFSTAAEFCSVAHGFKRGEFIGEEAGGAYCGNTSGNIVVLTLPETRMRLVLPLQRYEMAVPTAGEHQSRGVIPAHPVQVGIQDLRDGRDCELAKCIELIEQKRK